VIPANVLNLLTLVPAIFAGIEILVVSIIQIFSSFSLIKKASDRDTKKAIAFIGIAGIFIFMMFFFQISEELLRKVSFSSAYASPVDIARLMLDISLLVFLLFTYLGWIHPGLRKIGIKVDTG